MSKGIKAFLLDTQMDKDVRLIEARFGLTGYAILVKLWTMIYRDEGYYCKWDDDTKCLFAIEIFARLQQEGRANCRGVFEKGIVL